MVHDDFGAVVAVAAADASMSDIRYDVRIVVGRDAGTTSAARQYQHQHQQPATPLLPPKSPTYDHSWANHNHFFIIIVVFVDVVDIVPSWLPLLYGSYPLVDVILVIGIYLSNSKGTVSSYGITGIEAGSFCRIQVTSYKLEYSQCHGLCPTAFDFSSSVEVDQLF
jgi:hypothetical protein